MNEELKRVKRPSLRFNELEINFALSVIKKLKEPIELMYYLSEREDENPFVLIFISSENKNLKKIIKKQKRDTDVLLNIDKDKKLFAIICQETKVDGAYRFAERLVQKVRESSKDSVYCTEMEVRTTKYAAKEILFKAIDVYIRTRKEKRENEIIFHTI